MTNFLSTWFYTSPLGENIYYPGVGSNSSDWKFQKNYWHCILTFFDRLYRFKSNNLIDASFLLFLNEELPCDAIADQLDIKKYLSCRDVDVLSFSPGFSGVDKTKTFSSQFFIYDVLESAYSRLRDGDTLILVDSDVLPLNPINDRFFESLHSCGQAFYILDWQRDYVNNDLSLDQFVDILVRSCRNGESLKEEFLSNPFFVGGEFLAFTKSGLGFFLDSVSRMSPLAIGESGLSIQTEEHLNTIALLSSEKKYHSAIDIIRRVWTDPAKYRNVLNSDRGLPFVHLPAEKLQGFYHYYHQIILPSAAGGQPEDSIMSTEMLSPLFRI